MNHWWGGNPHSVEPVEVEEFDELPEEPDFDDTVHACSNCERPQQFAGLCASCHEEMRQTPNDAFWDSINF